MPSEPERFEQLRQDAQDAIDQLDGYDSGWASLTAADRTIAMRLAVRVVARLARIVLNRP